MIGLVALEVEEETDLPNVKKDYVETQRKVAVCKPGSGALARNQISGHLDLGFPSL